MFARHKVATSVGVVFVVLVIFVQIFAPHVFPTLWTSIAAPFWRIQFAYETGALRTHDELLAENQTLKAAIAEFEARYASSTTALLESQNDELLRLLGRSSLTSATSTTVVVETSPKKKTTTTTKISTSDQKQFRLAAVLARPTLTPFDELIIDLGSDDDISTTTLVYSEGRTNIGRVVDVLPHTSRVRLYSSPEETYSVFIGNDHIPATAHGKGGGQYSADVPHGSSVVTGDIVTDSSVHDRVFGTVVSVVTDPANPFDTVLFAPPVVLNSLRFVLVR